MLATLRGDLAQALEWHAFGPVLVGLALVLGLWTCFGGRLAPGRLLQLACAAALLAFGYWLLRLWAWSQGQPLPA